MSFSSSALVIVASALRAVGERDGDRRRRLATTWSAVRISAGVGDDDARALAVVGAPSGSPPSDSMRTSDGRISA